MPNTTRQRFKHPSQKVTAEISSVSNWIAANKLTLNWTKSNVIGVEPNSHNNKQKLTLPITRIIPGLNTTECTKYLEIILNNQLSFNAHIDMLTKKLSRAAGILCKLQSFLNKTTLLNLYYGLFHSNIEYGLLAWSATYKSYYNKISILQNKAVKIVGGGKWNDKATPFYANLNILKLFDLVQLYKAIFGFNFKSNKLPNTFKNYFKAACSIHGKNTRSSSLDNFFLPFYRTNKLQKSIKFQDPKIWNFIETSIKQCKSPKIFKKKLKCFLMKS